MSFDVILYEEDNEKEVLILNINSSSNILFIIKQIIQIVYSN